MDFFPDFFHFKKFVERYFLQQPIQSIMIISVGLLIWLTRAKKLSGYVLIFVGLLLLFATSLPVTGYLLGSFLEERAGPVLRRDDPRLNEVNDIVVLDNVSEAVRIWNELPYTRLIIAGYICNLGNGPYCTKTGSS